MGMNPLFCGKSKIWARTFAIPKTLSSWNSGLLMAAHLGSSRLNKGAISFSAKVPDPTEPSRLSILGVSCRDLKNQWFMHAFRFAKFMLCVSLYWKRIYWQTAMKIGGCKTMWQCVKAVPCVSKGRGSCRCKWFHVVYSLYFQFTTVSRKP